VTAIFPCYNLQGASDKIKVGKAGVMTKDQSKSSMQLFSQGCVINPYVMSEQLLTHFTPVMLKQQISDEEKLNQICVVTQPGPTSKRDRSIVQCFMDLSKLDIEKLVTASNDRKLGQLSESLEQLITRHEQQCLLYAYGDWIETIELLHHFRCKAEDKGKIKRSQRQHQVQLILWSQWKRASSLSNSIKTLFLRMCLQYLSNSFAAWKSTEQLRKRNSTIVSQISIETVMQKVLMSRIVQVWKLRYQLISRNKQVFAKQQARLVNKVRIFFSILMNSNESLSTQSVHLND
jgi:hypothetical protein